MLFVQLPYPNASPAQVERLVVRPVEEALGSVGGLRNMWSHIDSNGGMIGLEFDWSQNMKVARTDVWQKIDRVRRDLPDDVGTSWSPTTGAGGTRRCPSSRDVWPRNATFPRATTFWIVGS